MRIFMLTDVSFEDPILKSNNILFGLTNNCNYVLPDAVGQILLDEGLAAPYENQVFWNGGLL